MSRKILALPLLAALALVGCDDSSSSSSSAKCDGYKGTWGVSTSEDDRGVTIVVNTEIVFTASSFSSNYSRTFGGVPSRSGSAQGSLTDIGSSKIVVQATTVMESKSGGPAVRSTKPEDYTADTMMYSFPSAGTMLIKELSGGSEVDEGLLYTCK